MGKQQVKTFEAEVVSVLLADQPGTFVTRPVPSVRVELGGIPGDRHFGLLVPADVRQNYYPRGTPVANRRQLSLVTEEELLTIARNMGLSEILPEWLGANLLLRGFSGLTGLAQGARLLFPDGTGLICEGENLPCKGPGRVIAGVTGNESDAAGFVKAAKKLRGIVCSVEREGRIAAGDRVRIVVA